MMILFPFLFLSSTAIINVNAMQLRIASWNLRYDSLPDSLTISDSLSALPNPLQEPTQYLGEAGKELPWSTRRLRVAQTLLSENVDLIGSYTRIARRRICGIIWNVLQDFKKRYCDKLKISRNY